MPPLPRRTRLPLTDTSDNPPTTEAPSPPGTALRRARVAIALGLVIGVLIFGVLAITELSNPPQVSTQRAGNPFGTSDRMPTPEEAALGQRLLSGIAGVDQSKFIKIQRDNPHPGELTPFLNSDSYGQPPYRQPSIGGEVWELADYRVNDATVQAAYDHYEKQAKTRGMTLKMRGDMTSMPGGRKAVWTNGSHALELAAWPLASNEPIRPPLRPKTPLHWVVKYSYPENAPLTTNNR